MACGLPRNMPRNMPRDGFAFYLNAVAANMFKTLDADVFSARTRYPKGY